MKRVVALALVCLSLATVSAQEGSGKDASQETFKPPKNPEEYRAMLERLIANIKKEQENAPKTLTEAHERLEQTLSPETLAEIDAMKSEDEMIRYHIGLGSSIRGYWGLGGDLPLSQSLRELGFLASDDMSGLILETFWCKRHGRDLRLEERATKARRGQEIQRKIEEEQENRAREGYAAIRKMMMGLRFEPRDVSVVRMRIGRGLNVRSLSPFRDGVFLTVYNQGSMSDGPDVSEGRYRDPTDNGVRIEPQYDDAVRRGYCFDRAIREVRKMKPGEDFYIQGWYFKPTDGKAHWINVPEVNNVYAAVVADDRAWFAGVTDEEPVLVGVGDQDRFTVPLPQADEIPDLGLDGQLLLAVYSKTIYRFVDRSWELVHSGDILLPRSGPPPRRYGTRVFLRDEGHRERQKRLWWLAMGEKLHVHLLDHDTGLFQPIVEQREDWSEIHGVGPGGWDEASSYCVTRNGDLWASVAYGSYLLRRAQDGTYSYAIADGSLEFAEDPSDSRAKNPGLRVSGVTALLDDSLLLVGYAGLYRLQGKDLVQLLAFAPDVTPDSRGRVANRLNWTPTHVVALADGSYVVSTSEWDGLYWLRPGKDGQWTCQYPGRGDPVVW